jgi:hypothetical protein
MKRSGDPESSLPVTAEVGAEGGSFADAAMQTATFGRKELRRDVPMQEGGPPEGDEHAPSGMRRYPTEPPLPSTHSARADTWRAGIIGAAAGAAAGAAVALALIKRAR